jgi:hypothetical protein
MRGLAILALGSLAVASAVVLTRDPEEAWAVAVVIAGAGLAAGALASLLQLRSPRAGTRRRSHASVRAVAVRRGMEVAAAVALLLWLRAVDGFSMVTAAFVVVTFVATELVLSARPASSR